MERPASGEQLQRCAVIIVENLPVPFDRRVWQEACALRDADWTVSVISPKGPGAESDREVIDGIRVYRHPQPPDTPSLRGYVQEFSSALKWEARLLAVVAEEVGFDVIHICNPPDLLFLPSLPWKRRTGASLVFDHHDRAPELFEAKWGRRGVLYSGLTLAERMTFAAAETVIATNETHREVAIRRGRKRPEDVFVVRSSPPIAAVAVDAQAPKAADGRRRVGYVGVMGDQDGVDLLVRAAHHIVRTRDRDDVEFVLVGAGPSLPDLERMTAELGLQDRVRFTGMLDRPALLETLTTFDVGPRPIPRTSTTTDAR